MKKIILIVAVVLVAVVGLTSFNGREVKKEKSNSGLFASLSTTKTGLPTTQTTGGTKKSE